MSLEKNVKNLDIYTVITPESTIQKKAVDQKKFWHINKEMLRFKLHYLLLNGAFGCSVAYLTLFAQVRVGISASALAAILTTQRCTCIFTKVAIGYLADYFNKLKATICVLFVVVNIFNLLLLAVPKIETGTDHATVFDVLKDTTSYKLLNNSEIYIACEYPQRDSIRSPRILSLNGSLNSDLYLFSFDSFSTFLKNCSESKKNIFENESNDYNDVDVEQITNEGALLRIPYSCELCCKVSRECQTITFKAPEYHGMKVSSENIHVSNFQTYQFWLYGLISVIGTACGNGLFTLTDTACCESVQKTGAQYGRQRLWGAIGWGVMSPVGGLLNDYTGDFVATWILMAVMSFISLLNLTKIDMSKPHFSKNLMKDVGAVLASKEFITFSFCVLLNGVGTGFMWYYHVLFLTHIGASRFLVGIVMFIQSVIGVPFMFFSGWIIKKIGHYNVLTLSLVAYCIRFFWYTQLYNPWLDLPVEVLHGITFGLFYTNLASFAKLSAKPGTEATTQAILFTAHDGLGVGIGCVVAGVGFDTIGGRRTYAYMTICSGGAIVLSIILKCFVRKQKRTIKITSSKSA